MRRFFGGPKSVSEGAASNNNEDANNNNNSNVSFRDFPDAESTQSQPNP